MLTVGGDLPFPSLRAKRGNPSSRRKRKMLYQYWIASSLKVATFAPRNDGGGMAALTADPSIPSLRAKRGNPS